MTPEKQYTITSWPKPKWRVFIGGEQGVQIYLEHAPCRFHRFMQRLILGIVWEQTK